MQEGWKPPEDLDGCSKEEDPTLDQEPGSDQPVSSAEECFRKGRIGSFVRAQAKWCFKQGQEEPVPRVERLLSAEHLAACRRFDNLIWSLQATNGHPILFWLSVTVALTTFVHKKSILTVFQS